MALVVTPGAANADSYATLDEATAYNSSRTFADSWSNAEVDQQEASMREAARLLDAAFTWTGAAVDAVQALAWPRVGMVSRNGFGIASTVIPTELKVAQAEFARQLIDNNLLETNDVKAQGIHLIKAGPVSIAYQPKGTDDNSINAAIQLASPEFAWYSQVVPPAVTLLLVPSWYVRILVGPQFMFKAHR